MDDFIEDDDPAEETSSEFNPSDEMTPEVPEAKPAYETDSEADENDSEVPQEIQDALLRLLQTAEQEDLNIRLMQTQKWKRLEFYFNNITDIFWDEASGDWRQPNWEELGDEEDIADSRVINIYRAHAEAVIAAASIKVPGVVFFPKDAERYEDIQTAITKSKIAKLIQKQNKSSLLFMKALSIFFNEGTVFSYCYPHKSPEFGMKKTERFETETSTTYNLKCVNCGGDLGTESELPSNPVDCPECGTQAPPQVEADEVENQIPAGYDITPKEGTKINVYGPLDIKVSSYARNPQDCGYLIYKHSQSIAFLKSTYPEIAERIVASPGDGWDNDWTRLPVVYNGIAPDNTAVVKCVWFRPWQFAALSDLELAGRLKEQYPKGCYAIFVNDIFAEANNEDMDEHWAISCSPLSKTIHGEPLGTNLAVVQDLRSETMELKLQTMEHGISEVFVRSSAVDLDAYKDSRAAPGSIYPLKLDPDEKAGDLFYETRTATLSPEVDRLQRGLDEDAQFTTGSQPSIYGGTSGAGTTATEYRMSRAQALQRLSITWQLLSNWWAETIEKATLVFSDNLEEDDNFVTRENGAFKNNKIAKEDLMGEIQSVEPDYSDQLPLTWEQQHDVISNLFMMKDPAINAMLMHPMNNQLIKKSTGLQDLYIPGEDQRNKQFFEANLLMEQEPVKDEMGNEQPSIMPDGEDDDPIHIQVTKAILTSLKGLRLREEKPAGFRNLQLHLMAHEQKMAMKTQANGATPPGVPADTAAVDTIS